YRAILSINRFGPDKIVAWLYETATHSPLAAGASDAPMSGRRRQLGLEPPPNCQRWPHGGGVVEAEVSVIVSDLLTA
ncbi:MAG TPA: hypothetical protein VM536_16685, partial [Chloroflexia bacterium]|nr:hypothetical protein [Chloroflexia bacterium]